MKNRNRFQMMRNARRCSWGSLSVAIALAATPVLAQNPTGLTVDRALPIAHEAFNYPDGAELPLSRATGSGWSEDTGREGWRNLFTNDALGKLRYVVDRTSSISSPAGYSPAGEGGVVRSVTPGNNTTAYRNLEAPLDLGQARTIYFSMLKANDPAIASGFSLLTADRQMLVNFEDRGADVSGRVSSVFGEPAYLLGAKNPWTQDTHFLIVLRLTSDGQGGANVVWRWFEADRDPLPGAEPDDWQPLLSLRGLAGHSLAAVGFFIHGPADTGEFLGDIRIGESFQAVTTTPPLP